MTNASIHHVKSAIRRYLARYPDACDTLQGIQTWWLQEPTLSPKLIFDALHELEREGLMRQEQAEEVLWAGSELPPMQCSDD